MLKIILTPLLLISFILLLPSCTTRPNKAQITQAKFTVMKIGKGLPCCNPFLENPPQTMPSPQELMLKYKKDKKSSALLSQAVFNFEGGENPKTLNSPYFKLIVFADYNFFLAGDGAVRTLKRP
jgi:hypothetical protein